MALCNLAPAEWFAKPDESSFWLRIYTCLFIPHDAFDNAVTSMFGAPKDRTLAVTSEAPLICAFGTAKNLKVPVSTFEMTSSESGQLKVVCRVDEKELSSAPSVFLATPFKVDGGVGDESASRRRLDEVAALICLHAGPNFMRQIIFEGEVEASQGQLHVPGPPMKLPKPAEGPFLASQNGHDIYEISEALRDIADGPRKRRFLLALRLVDRAMRSEFGFLDYWTALEVACGGGAGRIKTALSRIYGIKNHNEAAEATRLALIAQWRHDYVHKGITPQMNADVERYLQLLFLDALRFELKLAPRGHLAAIQRADGFDLSALGIVGQ